MNGFIGDENGDILGGGGGGKPDALNKGERPDGGGIPAAKGGGGENGEKGDGEKSIGENPADCASIDERADCGPPNGGR